MRKIHTLERACPILLMLMLMQEVQMHTCLYSAWRELVVLARSAVPQTLSSLWCTYARDALPKIFTRKA